MSHRKGRLSLKGRKASKGQKGYPQALGGHDPEGRCPNGSMPTGACPTYTGSGAHVQPPSLDLFRASTLPTGTQSLTGKGYLFGPESGTSSIVAPDKVTKNETIPTSTILEVSQLWFTQFVMQHAHLITNDCSFTTIP
jgi:hypothetical protein